MEHLLLSQEAWYVKCHRLYNYIMICLCKNILINFSFSEYFTIIAHFITELYWCNYCHNSYSFQLKACWWSGLVAIRKWAWPLWNALTRTASLSILIKAKHWGADLELLIWNILKLYIKSQSRRRDSQTFCILKCFIDKFYRTLIKCSECLEKYDLSSVYPPIPPVQAYSEMRDHCWLLILIVDRLGDCYIDITN